MTNAGGRCTPVIPDEFDRARKVQQALALMTSALELLDAAGKDQAAISLSYAIHQAGGTAPLPPG